MHWESLRSIGKLLNSIIDKEYLGKIVKKYDTLKVYTTNCRTTLRELYNQGMLQPFLVVGNEMIKCEEEIFLYRPRQKVNIYTEIIKKNSANDLEAEIEIRNLVGSFSQEKAENYLVKMEEYRKQGTPLYKLLEELGDTDDTTILSSFFENCANEFKPTAKTKKEMMSHFREMCLYVISCNLREANLVEPRSEMLVDKLVAQLINNNCGIKNSMIWDLEIQPEYFEDGRLLPLLYMLPYIPLGRSNKDDIGTSISTFTKYDNAFFDIPLGIDLDIDLEKGNKSYTSWFVYFTYLNYLLFDTGGMTKPSMKYDLCESDYDSSYIQEKIQTSMRLSSKEKKGLQLLAMLFIANSDSNFRNTRGSSIYTNDDLLRLLQRTGAYKVPDLFNNIDIDLKPCPNNFIRKGKTLVKYLNSLGREDLIKKIKENQSAIPQKLNYISSSNSSRLGFIGSNLFNYANGELLLALLELDNQEFLGEPPITTESLVATRIFLMQKG